MQGQARGAHPGGSAGHLLGVGERGVVQPQPGLVAGGALALLPALGAAAAVGAAERGAGDEPVEGLQRVHPGGEEVPGLQPFGQAAGAARLQRVHQPHEEEEAEEGCAHPHQRLPARHGDAEDEGGQQEEADEEVQHGEPAVLGRALAQRLGHADGQAGEGQRVPQQDAGDVEEEVAEGNLQGWHPC